MIESLRGLGYSASTAIADLIDNSIAARARNVELLFHWAGAGSYIRIVDDGRGMTPKQLDQAMRLGAIDPLATRDPGDLGRFGLGLKTASFSQCRRFTVATVQDGVTDCLRWDLDFLAGNTDGGWYMLEGAHPGSEGLLDVLEGRAHGTVVLWEALDRFVTPGFTHQHFLDAIDGIENHLAMVFHRFLSGPSPRLAISINGKIIHPWDPFLSTNTAVIPQPEDPLRGSTGTIHVKPHVLPHKDKLDKTAYEQGAGIDGWTAQQGFYVYRNERLLVAGSWLGLGSPRPWSKEEAYRLARIRVDIPNSADSEWKIDLRKSEARPPAPLRQRLTRLAEDARELSRKVFAHRGEQTRGLATQPVEQVWRTDQTSSGIKYRIETAHPAIERVIAQAGALLPALKAMLRIIEETVPVQRIWLDTTEARETPVNCFNGEKDEAVMEVLREVYAGLLATGMTSIRAQEKLLRTEPFHKYPNLVASLAVEAGKSES